MDVEMSYWLKALSVQAWGPEFESLEFILSQVW